MAWSYWAPNHQCGLCLTGTLKLTFLFRTRGRGIRFLKQLVRFLRNGAIVCFLFVVFFFGIVLKKYK
jgi:hypothetical protein